MLLTSILVEAPKIIFFMLKYKKLNLCFLIELLNILRNIDLLSGLSFFPL